MSFISELFTLLFSLATTKYIYIYFKNQTWILHTYLLHSTLLVNRCCSLCMMMTCHKNKIEIQLFKKILLLHTHQQANSKQQHNKITELRMKVNVYFLKVIISHRINLISFFYIWKNIFCDISHFFVYKRHYYGRKIINSKLKTQDSTGLYHHLVLFLSSWEEIFC